MASLFFFFLILVAIAAYAISQSKQRAEEEKAKKNRRELAAAKHAVTEAIDGFFATQRHFRCTRRFDSVDCSSSFGVDDESGDLCLIDCRGGRVASSIIPWSCIAGVKVVEETGSVRQTQTDGASLLAGVVIGEILGGSTGALIGGMNAKRVTTSTHYSGRMELHVSVNLPERPLWKFVFSAELLERGSQAHTQRREAAELWEASLKASMRVGRQAGPARMASGGAARPRRQAAPPPLRAAPRLRDEPRYQVARGGNNLGEMSMTQIREMIEAGELSLDEDYYFDALAGEWFRLMLLEEVAA